MPKNIIGYDGSLLYLYYSGDAIPAVHQLVEYEQGNHFALFSEEVKNARQEADK